MKRLEEADRILAGDYYDLFERLDLHRDTRHDVSYAAGITSKQGIEALRQAAGELLELVNGYVEA